MKASARVVPGTRETDNTEEREGEERQWGIRALFWRYDFEYESNQHRMERIGANAAFNAGATEYDGNDLVLACVEGVDRKAFLAVAESPNAVDNFRFWDYPIVMPETNEPDTNVYDMRCCVTRTDGFTGSARSGRTGRCRNGTRPRWWRNAELHEPRTW